MSFRELQTRQPRQERTIPCGCVVTTVPPGHVVDVRWCPACLARVDGAVYAYDKWLEDAIFGTASGEDSPSSNEDKL